jgi:YVTN family beta-propeller protein
MKIHFRNALLSAIITGLWLTVDSVRPQAAGDYWVCVSNEKSGDISVLDATERKLVLTVPVGKRPRGIVASPDGKTLYVALSGTPISGPPQLDAKGNPILHKGEDDDDNAKRADKSADGIGVVDLVQGRFLRKIPAGSDPEQFALSADGTRLYVSNEDVVSTERLNTLFPSGANRKGFAPVRMERFSTSPARTMGRYSSWMLSVLK